MLLIYGVAAPYCYIHDCGILWLLNLLIAELFECRMQDNLLYARCGFPNAPVMDKIS